MPANWSTLDRVHVLEGRVLTHAKTADHYPSESHVLPAALGVVGAVVNVNIAGTVNDPLATVQALRRSSLQNERNLKTVIPAVTR
jgi:hypothetical protein